MQYEIHKTSNVFGPSVKALGYVVTLVSDSAEYEIGRYQRLATAKNAAQSDKGKPIRWTECGGSAVSVWWEGR